MSGTTATALMNRTYRHQRHIYDLTRKYFLLGRDRVIHQLAPTEGEAVLEIGCGTARNLVAVARRYPQARCFGIDVSTEMLTTAIAAVARAELSSRIRVAHGDATRCNAAALFASPRFERVFFSYSLSMIPDWQGALRNAIGLLADGGELHIVDFGDQAGLPRWFRNLLRRWIGMFHVTPRDTLAAELRWLAGAHKATLTIAQPYRGYAQHAILRLPPAAAAMDILSTHQRRYRSASTTAAKAGVACRRLGK